MKVIFVLLAVLAFLARASLPPYIPRVVPPPGPGGRILGGVKFGPCPVGFTRVKGFCSRVVNPRSVPCSPGFMRLPDGRCARYLNH